MDLKERMNAIVEVMRTTKESWVAESPENTDLSIYLHFWRGDDLVAALQCPLDRDRALHAGQIGCTGFGADTMSITFESYHSELGESPLTGKRWRPGEMQYVAQNNPEALEKGWVNECLTTSMHERGGGFMLHSEPYLIEDGKVEWRDATDISSAKENEGGGGVMFEYLQEVMAQPKMWDILQDKATSDALAKTMLGLVSDEEARLFHADFGTLRALEEQELVVGVVINAEPGSLRAKWIEERMGPADPE